MEESGSPSASALASGGDLRPADRRTRLLRKPPASWLHRVVRLSQIVLRGRLDGTSPVGAVWRLWAWQIWRRTFRRPAMIRCAEGSLVLAPSWSRMAAILAATGLTERDDSLFTLDLLRPGDVFVDVGSNIGFYTVLAARRGARVKAFDPTPTASAACERNVRLNGVQENATVHQAACGAVAGVARFTTGLDIKNHIVQGDGPGIEVPLTTLDAELAGEDGGLGMLKIDAEGHDLDVLKGALGAIERLRPVILCEIWKGGGPPRRLLEPFGYRPYSYVPATRSLTESLPRPRQQGNLLLVSDSNLETVRRRVMSAERPPLRAPSITWWFR